MLKAYPRHTINGSMELFWLACQTILRGKAQGGDHIEHFEKEFARYIGTQHAVGVESARKGLYLILKSRQFDKGDEVIMPAYTFQALPITVMACGLKPVFVDVDSSTSNMNPALIEEKITGRTRVLILTHMFGQPAEMISIMKIAQKHRLCVMEDCAHACGSKYKNQRLGSFGDAAIFSFKMGKNLPCFGGGMVTTNDSQIYRQLKGLVEQFPNPGHGGLFKEIISTFLFYCSTHRNIFPYVTYPLFRLLDLFGSDFSDNYIEEPLDMNRSMKSLENQKRLSNLQATIGLKQLAKLDVANQKLKINAQKLIQELKGIENISIPVDTPEADIPYLYFRIQVPHLKLFRKKLLSRGIDTKRDDMSVCPHLNIFKEYKAPCPVAEKLPETSLEIPHNSFLKDEDIRYIAKQIKQTAEEIGQSQTFNLETVQSEAMK